MAQVGSAMFDQMPHSPMYAAYAAVAPDVDAYPRLMDRTGALLRQPYDWSAEVAAMTVPTLLVYGDAERPDVARGRVLRPARRWAARRRVGRRRPAARRAGDPSGPHALRRFRGAPARRRRRRLPRRTRPQLSRPPLAAGAARGRGCGHGRLPAARGGLRLPGRRRAAALGSRLGFRTVLVEPDPARAPARRGRARAGFAELDAELAGGTADVVVTDHHREELGELLRDALARPARGSASWATRGTRARTSPR